LLKPNPHLILRAIDLLAATPDGCVLIGDSVSDIEGARAAGIRSVGLADKPGKERRLADAGADAVIHSMAQLSAALSEL
jgi:phosphoglycolate phosphatase